MVNIVINNRSIEAEEGTTVLQAALDNDIFIPHFCWHPKLSISGNCRMCAVEVEGRSKLEVSCNLRIEEGMVVRTETDRVEKARQQVLEFLLINHPIDCPVCDQSGECLLQDYHFRYSGRAGRFKEAKVHKPKAVDIGPHVKLDDERCILCSRCVRFCREVVKDPELCIASRGDRSYITTAPGERLDNPYSLNTVDVCPVGALTSKDFRFKKRVWLLRSTPSVCPDCSNGCRIWIDHADGVMYRWRPRGGDILCDKGRLSYREWQAGARLLHPTVNIGGELKKCDLKRAIAGLSGVMSHHPRDRVTVVVSAGCSVDAADALLGAFSGCRFYSAGRTADPAFADSIIRKADRNPNSRYLETLGLKEVAQDIDGDVLVLAGELSGDDTLCVSGFRWRNIVQFANHEAGVFPGAGLILPTAAFFEMAGEFVNYRGVRQGLEAAFSPKGEARSINDWIKLCST